MSPHPSPGEQFLCHALFTGSDYRAEPQEHSGLGGENHPRSLALPFPSHPGSPITVEPSPGAPDEAECHPRGAACFGVPPCSAVYPPRCSESTSSGRSFPTALPRESHIPAVPPPPAPQNQPSARHDTCPPAQPYRTRGPSAGLGAFCRAEQGVISIYLHLTTYCSSAEHGAPC